MTHCGYPEEGEKFLARNPGFDRVYDKVLAIANAVYSDDKKYGLTPHAVVAFGLVASAYEIFLEIVLLAANGFGRGAQARLRTLFEHVAVAAYLAKHLQEAEKFMSFQIVEHSKELRRAREVLNKPGNEEFFRQVDAHIAKLDAQLALKKAEFGKKFADSWHQGISKIAKDLGWDHHFFYNYLIPNRYVHASPGILERRVSEDPGEDRLFFEGAPDYDCADEAVRGALTMLGISFAVAKDIGIPVSDPELKDLSASLVATYQHRPNKNIL